MERSNQQNIDTSSSPRATAKRAGVQNPSGSNYEVAGPTIGGTPIPYDSGNIEVAKEHLADSLSKASIQDTTTTTNTTTPAAAAGDHTLKHTVVAGASTAAHTAAEAGKTVAAGAVAAGAATVAAVKSFFADKGTTHVEGTPSSTTTTTSTKAHPIADFPNTEVHNIHKDSTPSHAIRTHAATGPIHSVPVEVEPIHSTGLDDSKTTAASGYRAKEADLHSGTTASAAESIDSRPLTDKATAPVIGAASAIGTAAADTAAYLGNKATEAKDSVKNTVYNLTTSSSSDTPTSTTPSYATMDSTKGTYNPSVSSSNTNTNTSYTSPTSSSTTPLSEKVKAPAVGAASAIGSAAAGTAAYLGNKASEAKETVKDSVSSMTTPSSTSNTTSSYSNSRNTPAATETPAIKSTTHTTTTKAVPPTTTSASTAAMNEPLTKTTTSSINPVTKTEGIKAATVTPVTEPQIIHNPSLDTYKTPTSGTAGDKSTAPAVGAASAMGAAATGTAAYLGNRPSETNDSNKNNVNNLTSSSSSNPTSSYSTHPNIAPTTHNSAPMTTTPTHPTSANTANEISSADRTAAAMPASYHGSVPQVGPGEEVVWVKNVTTTDYYDDGTSTGRGEVVDRHQGVIDPNSYSTVKDNQAVYNNNDQQEHHERGAGRQI
ncbi:hypothetical protein BGW39_008256 [Mortierella sp. 14UC]|nr:hypothetical protein BGW39_008256 [Mortierella sp. 14UC]